MPVQQGVGGMDSRYLRADGSIPLSDNWNTQAWSIVVNSLRAISGSNIALGDLVGNLRIVNSTAEIIQILGASNALAEMRQKNATMTDLAGVGVRAVMADVNGKLSAP